MPELEDKIGAILNNPGMMQQIMAMAQSLGQQNEPQPDIPAPPDPAPSHINPELLQGVLKLAGPTGIDANQKALLHALRPYLTGARLQKLEKAMRAAKLAGAASSVLNSGALSFLTGR